MWKIRYRTHDGKVGAVAAEQELALAPLVWRQPA
jgi:hypothetical protein